MRRPFYFKGIRFEIECVGKVAFESPRVNGFPAFLFDRSERNKLARGFDSNFFLKLDLSAR
jgi:hypothetical protein